MPEFFITAAIIIAIIVAVVIVSLTATLSLRGILTVAYNGELTVSFRVLFINIPLYPFPKFKRRRRRRRSMSAREAARIRERARRKAEKKRLKRKQKAPTKKKEDQERKAKKDTGKFPVKETLTDAVDIVAAVTEAVVVIVKRFTHHLRIKVTRFKVRIASEDAALTAVTYGAVSQIINVLLPILSTVKGFKLPKNKDFDVSADFATTTPDIDIKISFSLRTWHLADVGVRALAGGIAKLIKRRARSDTPIPFSALLKKALPSVIGKETPTAEGK